MRCFSISVAQVVIRFYLMMAVVIIGGFTGMYWLALLALPIFLSTMLGVSFRREAGESATVKTLDKQPVKKQPTRIAA